MSNKKTNQPTIPSKDEQPEHSAFAVEMEELKRDMRSAQLVDWIHKNQQQLIAGVVIFLLVMVGISLWKENEKAKVESASLLYQQAMGAQETEKRQALFNQVIKDYPGSGYRVLSLLQLSVLASDPSEVLQQIIDSKDIQQELRWQARLDLAKYQIAHGKADTARALLSEPVGTQYEELRNYLLSTLSDGKQKIEYLKKASEGPSNDTLLKEKIDAMLAKSEAVE